MTIMSFQEALLTFGDVAAEKGHCAALQALWLRFDEQIDFDLVRVHVSR